MRIVLMMIALSGCATISLPSTAVVESPPSARLDEVAGEWSGSDWGRVVFNPNGTGSYTDTFGTGPGTIAVSRATDRSFAGRWGESEKRFGTLRFTLSPDGRTATGTWTPDPTCTIGDQGEHPLRWTRR